MQYLDKSEADITTLDPGNVFVGGRYHSLLPIMQEVYTNNQAFYYSVAVVKRNSLPELQTIAQLRGKKACFPGVGIHGGYIKLSQESREYLFWNFYTGGSSQFTHWCSLESWILLIAIIMSNQPANFLVLLVPLIHFPISITPWEITRTISVHCAPVKFLDRGAALMIHMQAIRYIKRWYF